MNIICKLVDTFWNYLGYKKIYLSFRLKSCIQSMLWHLCYLSSGYLNSTRNKIYLLTIQTRFGAVFVRSIKCRIELEFVYCFITNQNKMIIRFLHFKSIHSVIFRQHAASIYGFVRLLVCLVSSKKNQATSKQGRRLKFSMLTALTNIRSAKVLHHASCIMHHASQATSKQGRRLRFGMLTVLTNIR